MSEDAEQKLMRSHTQLFPQSYHLKIGRSRPGDEQVGDDVDARLRIMRAHDSCRGGIVNNDGHRALRDPSKHGVSEVFRTCTRPGPRLPQAARVVRSPAA